MLVVLLSKLTLGTVKMQCLKEPRLPWNYMACFRYFHHSDLSCDY